MDTHIRVSLNQDYRFSVEILNFHGPGVHLEVLLDTADCSSGRTRSMRRGRSTQVSVFDPESSGNRFSAEFKLTGDGGSPYEFGIRFSVDGDYFALGGLSMGDMVRINREFARVIREAKHARVV